MPPWSGMGLTAHTTAATDNAKTPIDTMNMNSQGLATEHKHAPLVQLSIADAMQQSKKHSWKMCCMGINKGSSRDAVACEKIHESV